MPIDKSLQSQLLDLRALLIEEMLKSNDGGLFPEHELKKYSVQRTSYDVLHDKEIYPIQEFMDICNKINECAFTLDEGIELYHSKNPVIRYWAMQGIYALGKYSYVIRQ